MASITVETKKKFHPIIKVTKITLVTFLIHASLGMLYIFIIYDKGGLNKTGLQPVSRTCGTGSVIFLQR